MLPPSAEIIDANGDPLEHAFNHIMESVDAAHYAAISGGASAGCGSSSDDAMDAACDRALGEWLASHRGDEHYDQPRRA